MSNQELDNIKSILFLELRPWIFGSNPDIKFKQLLTETNKVQYNFQPKYELAFDNPISNIRKWYVRIIDNAFIEYLNKTHRSISESNADSEKKYYVHFALTRTLSQIMKDINSIIDERGYATEQYNISNLKKLSSPQLADEAFVMHYLKHCCVAVFLDVQDSFASLLKEEPLTQEEVYYSYFKENSPEPAVIIEASPIETTILFSNQIEPKVEVTFTPTQAEIRNTAKGVLDYTTIVKTPKRFADFEEKLFQNGYIDDNYNFTDTHGFKIELAAIYHHVINKGYFNPRKFQPVKEIKPLDIRKFLDHRYNCNLDKQFRNHTPESIQVIIDKYNWLSTLPLA